MTETPARQPASSDAVLREALEKIAAGKVPAPDEVMSAHGARDFARQLQELARAALSSAPSLAAGAVQKQAIEQILDMVLSRGPTPSGTYRERAEAIVAALSSPAAGSDGWQRDAALEEAAKIAEGEYGQNAWKLHMPISDYIAKAIRALKSAATASGGE